MEDRETRVEASGVLAGRSEVEKLRDTLSWPTRAARGLRKRKGK